MLTPSRAAGGLGSALVLASLLTGCTGDGGGSPTSSPTATVTATVTATADPVEEQEAVRLEAASSGTTCYDRPYPDLAWFDVTYEASRDVSSIDFTVVGADGLAQVGPTINLPPVNFGGTIAFGGELAWPPGDLVRDARQISWTARSRASSLSLAQGQTGLLMFHLRLDRSVLDGDRTARLGGIRATWREPDGTKGVSELPVEQEISFRPADCR